MESGDVISRAKWTATSARNRLAQHLTLVSRVRATFLESFWITTSLQPVQSYRLLHHWLISFPCFWSSLLLHSLLSRCGWSVSFVCVSWQGVAAAESQPTLFYTLSKPPLVYNLHGSRLLFRQNWANFLYPVSFSLCLPLLRYFQTIAPAWMKHRPFFSTFRSIVNLSENIRPPWTLIDRVCSPG